MKKVYKCAACGKAMKTTADINEVKLNTITRYFCNGCFNKILDFMLSME